MLQCAGIADFVCCVGDGEHYRYVYASPSRELVIVQPIVIQFGISREFEVGVTSSVNSRECR